MFLRPYRLAALLSLIAIVPIGYWIRFSTFPNAAWLNDALGSVAYEIFWILLLVLLMPRILPSRAAIATFLATCAIEFLQLWKPAWLEAIRATLPGRLVLGNTFTWTDFPAYAIGSFGGWLWITWLRQKYYLVKRK